MSQDHSAPVDPSSEDHYLRRELEDLLREVPFVFDFLRGNSNDGIWYWDLEQREHEWMNPRFWEVLGYDPADRQHLASEWQALIHPDDLATALDNLHMHCADPDHLYDQIVRYRHRDGSIVWIRCRGLAIWDNGKPVRMLGAHTVVTQLEKAEQLLSRKAAELLGRTHEIGRLEVQLARCAHIGGEMRVALADLASCLDRLRDQCADGIGEQSRQHIDGAVHRAARVRASIDKLMQTLTGD